VPRSDSPVVECDVHVGDVHLRSPMMTASGTAGYGAELLGHFDVARLGAVVTKSLAPYEWEGNPAPRLHPVGAGMINAVGLQGPGVEYWLHNLLPPLVEAGAAVVCSIWGRSVDDYARAADMLAQAPSEVIAVEVNLSCPNLEGRGSIFAHDAALSAEVMDACSVAGRPLWAKLSPNTDRIVDVAGAVVDAGADALTLVNTLLGLAIDPQTRRPALGNGGGGLSGPPVHAVAVRAIADVHRAMPTVPIIGVGGISTGWDAIEMMLVGASAVQVGTASFVDPRAPLRITAEMVRWARDNGVERLGDLTGSAIG